MRRAGTLSFVLALSVAASARRRPSDERFFDAFLPVMVGMGILIVAVVTVANVVAARQRALRQIPPPFDPTLGPPASSSGVGPFGGTSVGTPHNVASKTTTTSSDGSITVTVIEETISSVPFGTNGVVDPELFKGATGGALEQEILTEVRDAFRRMGSPPDIR